MHDIIASIHNIYIIYVSHETTSEITDSVISMVHEFRNRPLNKCHPFVFVIAMFISVKSKPELGQKVLYRMIGIDIERRKGCPCILVI
jgi:putative transposase